MEISKVLKFIAKVTKMSELSDLQVVLIMLSGAAFVGVVVWKNARVRKFLGMGSGGSDKPGDPPKQQQ